MILCVFLYTITLDFCSKFPKSGVFPIIKQMFDGRFVADLAYVADPGLLLLHGRGDQVDGDLAVVGALAGAAAGRGALDVQDDFEVAVVQVRRFVRAAARRRSQVGRRGCAALAGAAGLTRRRAH